MCGAGAGSCSELSQGERAREVSKFHRTVEPPRDGEETHGDLMMAPRGIGVRPA